MTDSQTLLAEYARTGSDAAFRKLVTRYVDLVYSTALRLVNGDTHRAEDVAQTVFIDLARLARTLSNDVMPGGWLHRHTCFVAANTMRGERRRQFRERQAVEMNALQDNSGADFSLVAPILDEAINELGEADRAAILLRFFEQRDFRSVGQALGGSEDAARMRVNRALEKLESLLKRRNITASSAALAVVLGANAVQAAPAGLAVTISAAAALAGTTIATTSTATVTKTIAMTAFQKTLIVASITAAVGTGIYQARQASTLRAQVQTLQQQQTPVNRQIRQLTADRDEAARQLAALAAENAALKKNPNEVLKLRGEVGTLRSDVKDLSQVASDPFVQDALAWKAKEVKLRQLLAERPDQKIPELGLLDDRTFLDVARDANLDTEDGIRAALSRLRHVAENQLASTLQPALQQWYYTQGNEGHAPQNVAQLAAYIDPPIDNSIFERYEILNTGTNVAGGWKGGWVISQKKAVDADYDRQWLISPVGFSSRDFKTRGQ